MNQGCPELAYLEQAARLALRGHGRVEPNPMVGCIIARDGGRIAGRGFHRLFGGPHAEVEALRGAGPAARGAVVYTTLEPCSHHGKTPPCTEALIAAGVSRVVIAEPDPHAGHGGGAEYLRKRGIDVEFNHRCALAGLVSAPFRRRVETGLPWITAKWAQTIDGCIAARSGESKWISCERSRRMVHRERGRVDAILTGIGTVLRDDPLLTARHGRPRRIARRIVIDRDLRTPVDSRIAQTAAHIPTSIVCAAGGDQFQRERAEKLAAQGAGIIEWPSDAAGRFALVELMRSLAARYQITQVLTECGPGLLGSLFAENLICACWVFVAPLILGDDRAMHSVTGFEPMQISESRRASLFDIRRRGDDIAALYLPMFSHAHP